METRALFLTALAPAVWGSTYIVATQFLPGWSPLWVACLRALPAGLLLLLALRVLPTGVWWARVVILGALNFTVFWTCLFIAAYRLPGGVAAILGALQPIMVMALSHLLLGQRMRTRAALAALMGATGVGLLVGAPAAQLDTIGVIAGLAGAASMALGVVLTRAWQPPVSPLVFTSWQMTAGGALLLPAALLSGAMPGTLDASSMLGLLYLAVIGGALTYVLWFAGIARIGPSLASTLGLLSPLSAAILGYVFLGEALSGPQAIGACIVIASVWWSQRALRATAISARVGATKS